MALGHLARPDLSPVGATPVRVLFLNTRARLGADVAVHATLARWLDRTQTAIWVATSADQVLGDSSATVFAAIPNLTLLPMNLGVPVNEWNGKRRAGAYARNMGSVANLARLAMFCRRKRIDLIHVSERPREALAGLLLARAAGCRCLIHAHTGYYRHDATRLFNWTIRRADAIVGVSRFTASTYTQAAALPEEKVYSVYNAVDTAHFALAPLAERAAMRDRFGVPQDAPLIGYAARLTRWKGQTDLLDALALVRQTFPRARLLLAGEVKDVAPDGGGDFRAYLDRRVAELGLGDAVTFAGMLPHDEMPAFFSALDVVAHPAIEEPFGLAIVEAMACERPVVAVGAGGVPEIIRDGVDGLLTPPQTPAALATELIRVLTDADLSARLGRAGRAHVERLFSPQRQAEAMAQVYHQILGRGPEERLLAAATQDG